MSESDTELDGDDYTIDPADVIKVIDLDDLDVEGRVNDEDDDNEEETNGMLFF